MKQLRSYRLMMLLAVAAVLSIVLPAWREAQAFSAVRNLDLDTHSIILRGAWEQLSQDPVFKDSGFPRIDGILGFEGVFKEMSNPFATGGGGPDVKGRTRDGEHYYNPRIKGKNKGGAPASVGKYYSMLVKRMLGGQEGVSPEQAAAWAAHFLADMNVPYHIVGIPAGGAEEIYVGGIPGRTAHNLTPDESGPLWLKEIPLTYSGLWKAFTFDFYRDWPGWGTTQDFERAIASFHAVRERAGSEKELNDWFDPWYYNGWGVGVDPFQTNPVVHNSSHAKWEVWAHLYLTRWTKYKPSINTGFHPQWKNGWVSFNDKIPWDAQRMQAEEFAKKAAEQTRDEIQQVHRSPDIAADDAVWRVMTLWRASISAMKPSMEVKQDVTNPARHELRAIIDNREKENAFDVKVRLTLTGDGSTFTELKNITESIPASGKRDVAFTIEPKDPGKCRVRIEVIGHYEKTPDLQYAKTEEPFSGIRRSGDEAQNTILRGILDGLKQAAEKAESLSAQIEQLCLSSSRDTKAVETCLENLKSRVASMEEQVRSVETNSEAMRQKAESTRQHHLDAEECATNEGKVAHEAESVSKELCEATKAVQNAQSGEERRQLFDGMESTKEELKVFLSEGASFLERAKRATRSSRTVLKEMEALVKDAPQRVHPEASPEILERRFRDAMERVTPAQKKLKELDSLQAGAREQHGEGQKILASLQATADTDKVRSEMDGYMGRIAKARDQVGDCPGKALTGLEDIRRSALPVNEAYTRAGEAIGAFRDKNPDKDAIEKAREKVSLTEYLFQMTGAYMERVRRACTDGAFCFTLAQDAMRRPVYVVVPDVRGKHVDGAAGVLRSKNFKPQPSGIGAAPKMDLEFKVQSQSPAGNHKAPEGSSVTIHYYGQFNTLDAARNADCSRWPGSVGKWDAGHNRAVCVCPAGSSWNRTRTSCINDREAALANVDCSKYPGSIAAYDDRTRRAGCQCRQGLAWNRNRTGCVDARAAVLETTDCSGFPGTRPAWNQQSGKVECFCPQGSLWDNAGRRCVSRQDLDNYCNQMGARLNAAARANNIKVFRELLPLVRDCDFYNQALADLRTMEYNQQMAMMNQMTTMMGAMRPPQQPPPSRPPTGGTTTAPVRPSTPTISPVRPPPGTTSQPGTLKPPQTTGGGNKIDCDKKYCPICGNDNVDLLGQSVSQQCMDCRKRFAAQIADCKRGGAAANTPGATVAQFKNHYVLQCVRQRWNTAMKRYDTITVYAVYGPGKQYPSGNCKRVYGPDTESQCSIRADGWSRPRGLR